MTLSSRGQWHILGSAVWLVALAVTPASCSESHHGDDDDDSSGDAGMSSVTVGGTHAGTTTGGSNGTAGSAMSGGADATGGANGSAGNATGSGGASSGGSGQGGDSGPGSGGSNENAGAAGASDCTGEECLPVSVCGNVKVESGESCDDGNSLPFDGCGADCQIEPECSGSACAGRCGDGIIVSGEECDDGNTHDGDGCSSTCVVEGGYSCTAAECDKIGGSCVVRLPAVFRDFNASTVTGGHPDFQPTFTSAGAVQGLVLTDLDQDGKPVQSSKANSTDAGGFMHGQSAFAQWYRNDPPAGKPISGQLVLWDDGNGGYVNRWGANGEQWQGQATTLYCGAGDCSVCPAPGPDETCEVCGDLPSNSCLVKRTPYDGNPLFFPIDSGVGVLNELRSEGKVPDQYGWAGWPWEHMAATTLGISTPIATATAPFPSTTHNFSFTTEIKFWFRYEADKTQILSFSGDDDAWLFVNGHLAGDLGGWHTPLDATVTIQGGTVTSAAQLRDAGTASMKSAPVTDFGLVDGQIYQIAVFQAERQIEGSSFKLGLSGLDVAKSTCVKN